MFDGVTPETSHLPFIMNPSLVRLFSTALLVGASASSALAQGQPVGPNSRTTGLVLRELVAGSTTASGGVPLMTVTAPPGSTYFLFSEGGIPSMLRDFTAMVPPVLGPLSLQAGTPVDVTLFADPLGGTVGQIPQSGFQDLNLTVPVPNLGSGFALEFQAVVVDPDGTLRFTNSQIRTLEGAPPGLGFTQSPVYPESAAQSWDDIEQGDVDGDGDLDRIGISQDGADRVQLFRMNTVSTGVPGVPASEPQYDITLVDAADGGSPTSAELADFNDDGFLDLVVVQLGSLEFLRIWMNDGLDSSGKWIGFTELPADSITFLGAPADPTDVETGDVDGDGDLDIFMTCALNPAVGQQNHLFLQTGITADGGPLFEDATLTNLPIILDDTEDSEFFDYDADGDLDIVVAVIEASPVLGQPGLDYVLENQGGLQGGVEGVYIADLTILPVAADESTDVVVADFDMDGNPDLYFANWFETNGSLVNVQVAVPDRMLINDFPAPVFVLGGPLPAAGDVAGTDAEVADFDLDGDLDIIMSNGSLRNIQALGQPGTTGTRVLINPAVGGGAWANFGGPVFPPETANYDLRDLETGDWSRYDLVLNAFIGSRWFDQDVGLAPLGTPAVPVYIPVGLSSLDRN